MDIGDRGANTTGARCLWRRSHTRARVLRAARAFVVAITLVTVIAPAPGAAAPGKPGHRLSPVGADSWEGAGFEEQLGLFFSPGAVIIRDLAAGGPPPELRLQLTEWGPIGALAPAVAPRIAAGDYAVEYIHGCLTERYANTRQGLKIQLAIAPAPQERLQIQFELGGTLAVKLQQDDRSVLIVDPLAFPVFSLRGLSVSDGDGRDVDATWNLIPGVNGRPERLVLELDARDHQSPITTTMVVGRADRQDRGAENRGETAAGGAPLAPLAAPANDECSGAEVVPAAGPFPHLTKTYNITDATSVGDPPPPTCQANVSRSIWFRFAPAATGDYTLALCSDASPGTTVDDTVLAVYASSNGTCGGAFTEIPGWCDDDSCTVETLQSTLADLHLVAGQTYFIVAFLFDTVPPEVGFDEVQLRVSRAPPPPPPPANDQCSGAEAIPGAGPFPHLTSTTADITGATSTGDPAAPTCQPSVSRGIWYTFTPGHTGTYQISSCADAPTATTVDDTVLSVYTSSNGACSGTMTQVAGACDNDSCAVAPAQAVISAAPMTAGVKYFILAYKAGAGAPAAGSTAVQLFVDDNPPGPPNDACAGAIPIPGGGPFPVLSTTTADITWATSTGDPPAPSCQNNVSRSVWYSFTPQTSGAYTVSVCADAPTTTTVDDTVLAIYTSSDGSCSGVFTQVAGACDDDSCTGEANQSVINPVSLTAGVSYYILVYEFGSTTPAPDNAAVQVRIGFDEPPLNDRCGSPTRLWLDAPLAGQTLLAANDYQLVDAACFSGIGQGLSMAPGRDVVYMFTAPDADRYSFRVTRYSTTLNPVLYVASDCPVGPQPAAIRGCLKAANRATTAGAEEVDCLPLAAGQRVYVYVDETADSAGSSFTIEANRCALEAEPNGTPAAAGPIACGLEGSISSYGEADFFALGAPAASSRVFAAVDGVAANSQDFDLRVTTATDTLEYDDANNDVALGGLSANVAGTPLTGGGSYLKVNHYSTAVVSEPYRLYASVRPPSSQATSEVEPNDTIAQATAGANGYFSGALAMSSDVDVFSFQAKLGDLVMLSLDLDPLRDRTPFNGALSLLDPTGAVITMANDGGSTSSITPGTGSLSAVTPNSPAEVIVHRTRAAGTYYAKVSWSSGTPGDYLLSIVSLCGIQDGDGDGVPDSEDCAPADASAWAPPGDATTLAFAGAPADLATLSWNRPSAPGATEVRYDLLRSGVASDFAAPTCVANGVLAISAKDAARPATGAAFHYLVRTKNTCGVNAGADWQGTSRTTGPCP